MQRQDPQNPPQNPARPPEYKYVHGKGGHAFGRHVHAMTYARTLAYTGRVNHTDGTFSMFARRERPHVVLDPVTGAPTHLLTGVCLNWNNPPTPSCGSPYAWENQPGCDPSFTHIQAINTAA